jgi:hypothetical protein
MSRTSLIALVLAIASTIGCNDNAPLGTDSGGGGQDAGVTDDAFVPPSDAEVDAYRMSPYVPHDAGYGDAGPAVAFTGAMNTWQGVTIDDARCGNGSPLVVGVNLSSASNDVVILFQGGGACWDSTTCDTFRTASHVTDTLTAGTVIGEATNGSSFLFSRTPSNPYHDASYIYIPYCTGDAHAGDNVVDFGARMMHFEGAHNAQLVFDRAHATWPTAARVTLIGFSAGGYGVLANWGPAQDTFVGARVDAISDSGLPLDVPLSRWRQMLTAWGLNFPAACTACDSMGDALPYYATSMPSPHRFALLAYLDDTVIPGFYNETQMQVHTQLLALRTTTSATANQRSFYSAASGHVLMTSPTLTAGGVTVQEWVTRFATDDPSWADVGP